jgi:predicted DNA-binding protein
MVVSGRIDVMGRVDLKSDLYYNFLNCDTFHFKGGNVKMPLSLRIPPEKEKMIKIASEKAGKTKSAFIAEAIDEKLGIIKDREKMVRQLAGWLTHEEAEELRNSLDVFNHIVEDDWP